MNEKLNGGGREQVAQVPALYFKICNFGRKLAFFCPKPPRNLLKMAK